MGKELETDNQLIEAVKNTSCEESLKELIKRHSPLCFKIYNYYYGALAQSGSIYLDFNTEKDYLIYQAAISFDANKAKFCTWVGQKVLFYCLDKLRNINKTVSYDHEHLKNLIEREVNTETNNEDLKDYIINILSRLKDKRIKLIYEMRYFNNQNRNMAWRHIANKLNISIQTAINLHKSAEKLLKEKLTKDKAFDTI